MSGRVNLMAPEVRADPYPTYAGLRRDAPVCQVDPGGMWAVSRYEDVVTVLKSPQLFSSEGFRRALMPPWLERNPMATSLMLRDPPSHGRLRALVNRAFLGSVLERVRPFIRSTMKQLAENMVSKRSVDFVAEVALPLPAMVISHLVGVDLALAKRFQRWTDTLTAIPSIPPDNLAAQQEANNSLKEMADCLTRVLEDRRREPRKDMVTELLQAQEEGQALNEEELLAFLSVLVAAGFETTMLLLGLMALRLAERPEMLERLRADLSLIPAFTEELLRHEPPSQGIFRLATREVELSGVRIPEHAQVLVLLNSASRDEAYAADGEQFILGRQITQNIAFGHGIHYCLGATLARMEACIALEELLPRIRGLKPGPKPVQWNASLLVRGPTELHLEVLPA